VKVATTQEKAKKKTPVKKGTSHKKAKKKKTPVKKATIQEKAKKKIPVKKTTSKEKKNVSFVPVMPSRAAYAWCKKKPSLLALWLIQPKACFSYLLCETSF
jgi:hypothetical protein